MNIFFAIAPMAFSDIVISNKPFCIQTAAYSNGSIEIKSSMCAFEIVLDTRCSKGFNREGSLLCRYNFAILFNTPKTLYHSLRDRKFFDIL